NGDGHQAVVAAGNGFVLVFRGNGDGTLGARTQYDLTGHCISAIALADFNNDGQIDLVTIGNPTGHVLLGAGDGTLGPPHTFGRFISSAGQTLAIGDLDE